MADKRPSDETAHKGSIGNREVVLASIKQEIDQLTPSPLYELRQAKGYHPVVGEGDLHSPIMFIGEAPGEREAKTGRPFVGASGRVLDELLESIGLARSSIYITNVVKDRPPENRDPTVAEIELYTPFLVRQIETIQPRVIATLGRFAMDFVLDLLDIQTDETPKISALHGTVLKGHAAYGDVAVVPLFHPAVALYSSGRKSTLLEDFQVLKQFVD